MGLEAGETDPLSSAHFHNPPTNFLVNPILFALDIQHVDLNTADSCRAGILFLTPAGQLDSLIPDDPQACPSRFPDLSEFPIELSFSVWHEKSKG